MDDCYSTLLHNPDSDQGLTVSDCSGNTARDCYTSDLHRVGSHLFRRGNRIYYRRRVPEALREIVGKGEVWRSLKTDSLTVARKRSHRVAAEIERDFEAARVSMGLPGDALVLAGANADERVLEIAPAAITSECAPGHTLAQLYDAYMTDPTRDWSPRTRQAYQTTRNLVLAVLGENTPIRSITRAQCRDMIETFRWQPRHARQLYPGLGPHELAKKVRDEGLTGPMSPSNLNTYINKLGGVFNWAVKEEMLDRNPARGLRVPDPVLRRDKRLPFATDQLRAIFSAPLYVGCRDGGHGYAEPGADRPRNARFWLPLISLFCGLRQNEACQLDVSDVRLIDDVACFIITVKRRPKLTPNMRPKLTPLRSVPGPAARRVAVS